MKLFTEKVTPVTLGILMLVMVVSTGCTAASTLALEAIVHSAGAAELERAWGPSYYRDDPALLEGVPSVASTSRRRFSPSYWRDDPALFASPAMPSVTVERWGPLTTETTQRSSMELSLLPRRPRSASVLPD